MPTDQLACQRSATSLAYWGESRTEVTIDMDISCSASGDTVSVVVVGDIDMATAPLLEAELNTIRARRPANVHIDLSAVTFLSRAGIEVLWNARQHSGGSFTISGASPPVRRLLRILQLQQLLQHQSSQVA